MIHVVIDRDSFIVKKIRKITQVKVNDNVIYLLKGPMKLAKEKQPSNIKFITNFPFVNSVLRYPKFSKETKVIFLPISGPCLGDVNYGMEAERFFII